jgi:hypothetical protein
MPDNNIPLLDRSPHMVGPLELELLLRRPILFSDINAPLAHGGLLPEPRLVRCCQHTDPEPRQVLI